jgi:hypothetical protein
VAGLGTIPREWFESRIIGVGRVTGSYADLYSPEWIAYLRPKVQPLCVELGLPDFDLSILMQAEKRIITQTVSSYVKDLDSFAGIYYASRYGLGLEDWALFEYDAVLYPMPNRPISPGPELKKALELLRFASALLALRGGEVATRSKPARGGALRERRCRAVRWRGWFG